MNRWLLFIASFVFLLGCTGQEIASVVEVPVGETIPNETIEETAEVVPIPNESPPRVTPLEVSEELEEYLPLPRKEVLIYLGVWMPSIESQEDYSVADREDLHALGANTVAFGVGIPYDSNGDIREEDVDHLKQLVRERIRYYKDVGLVVIFSPEPVPVNVWDEPGPVPESIQETFLENYNPVILDFAQIVEEENVEVFSPMNEPDFKLGVERSSSWGQEILPAVRQAYNGQILWKGALGEHLHGPKRIDFRGYDMLGFSVFPFGDFRYYPEGVGENIANINAWAREDNVPVVLVSEFGNYDGTGLSRSISAEAIQIVFEQGEGQLDGFIVFDPPRGFGQPIKGSNVEIIVHEWFVRLNQS